MKEWSGFVHERKVLRVTQSIGMQRSSYWLQFSYKYNVPLFIIFGILHWCVSQNIFFARVIFLNNENNVDSYESIFKCDYFNIVIISVIILGSIIVLMKIFFESRKYKTGMSFVENCNVVISAVCHFLKNDSNANLFSILWEVVETKKNSIKHCCFSNLGDSSFVENEMYAEMKKIVNSDFRQDSFEQPVKKIINRRKKSV